MDIRLSNEEDEIIVEILDQAANQWQFYATQCSTVISELESIQSDMQWITKLRNKELNRLHEHINPLVEQQMYPKKEDDRILIEVLSQAVDQWEVYANQCNDTFWEIESLHNDIRSGSGRRKEELNRLNRHIEALLIQKQKPITPTVQQKTDLDIGLDRQTNNADYEARNLFPKDTSAQKMTSANLMYQHQQKLDADNRSDNRTKSFHSLESYKEPPLSAGVVFMPSNECLHQSFNSVENYFSTNACATQRNTTMDSKDISSDSSDGDPWDKPEIDHVPVWTNSDDGNNRSEVNCTREEEGWDCINCDTNYSLKPTQCSCSCYLAAQNSTTSEKQEHSLDDTSSKVDCFIYLNTDKTQIESSETETSDITQEPSNTCSVADFDDEDTLVMEVFRTRCKLYRFNTNKRDWDVLGVGNLCVFINTDGMVECIMRDEQDRHKISRFFIKKGMSICKMVKSQAALFWFCEDLKDGMQTTEKLAARFQTIDEANEFIRTFEAYCK